MIGKFRFAITALIALVALVPFDSYAANEDLPVVELLGGKYYVYTAKKGETLFGIARKYNWDDKVLADLNRTAISPLKKGMQIYYPAETAQAEEPVAKQAVEDTDLKHKIKRGETVYSIAGMYGVTVERLYQLNPDSRNGIKAGDTLLIKKAGSIPEGNVGNENGAMFYTVKQGDTLYSLSQTFKVSIASIMHNNAGVNERNLKAGSIVKIPKSGTGLVTTTKVVEESSLEGVELKQISKNETWSSLAKKNDIDEATLREANPTVTELKNKSYIAVPKIETSVTELEVVAEDPREATVKGQSEIYDDVHNIADPSEEEVMNVRVAIIAENPDSKKDKEFLRGFLAGVDRQKNKGFKVSLKVINGTDSMARITDQLDEFKPTIVFETSENQLPIYLGDYAYKNSVPLVNTFDVKSEEYVTNPYVIQLLPPSQLFNENVAHYIHQRFDGYKLLMIGTKDDSDQLADALLSIWDESLVKRAPTEAVVPRAFSDDGKYLIYGYDVKKGDVSDLLKRVAKVREEHLLADIVMLGRPNLIMYEDALHDDFSNASMSMPSRFYVDKESSEYREFLQRYKLMYDATPAKSVPLYAAVGYDTSNYFISSLAKAGGDINKIGQSHNTVQSDYKLWRPNNWSGFLNPPVFVIDYTPIGGIKNVVSYTE